MRVLRLVGAVVVVTGCGGGGGGGGGTPPPPAVASTTINPSSAQSINVAGTVAFSAQPKDAQGGNLTRTVTWSTSDATKVSLSATTGASVTATGVAVGSSQIRATSETVPSTLVTVTVTPSGPNPMTADVTATATDTFNPSTVTIAPGGTVTWTFVPAREHNVTFTGNAPPGGTIGTTSNTTVSRTFPNAGSYPYTCTLHSGMNGTVNVQ